MTETTITAPAVWEPPAAVRVRGTLALIVGGGETARVYERFGRRISTDGYVVGVFESAVEATPWLAAHQEPRVLVGSDRGAAAALSHAATGAAAGLDGVIVAGLPVAGSDDASADASARTACPVHLGVLGGDDARAQATLDGPAEIPDAASLGTVSVPVLAIHGGADTVAPFAQARAALVALPHLELIETVDGLHDALNDQSHRSVAARVVLWLERLRAQGVDAPIVREVSA